MVKRLSLLILLFVILTGFFVLYNKSGIRYIQSLSFYKTKNPPLALLNIPKVSPTVTPFLAKTVNVVSPDMKQTLIMKEQGNQSSTTHTFLVLGEKNETPKQIFSKTVNLPQTITIPFNTWSPGNKYLFLKENKAGKDSYIVLTSIGKELTKNFQTVNIEDLFMEKYKDYKITEVTGWAGPTLLIVNTDNTDGTLGPSFWFDVTSLKFIQLSTRFN